MTLTFPNTDLATLIGKMSVKFWLADNMQSSGQANGNIIVADLGPKYWMAEIGAIDMSHDEASQLQAQIEALDGGLNNFYLWDPRRAYPQYDPDGSILGASTVQLTDASSDGKSVKFGGLPSGYRMTTGDLFHFNFGPSSAYRAMHRIIVGDAANGSGDTTWMEIRPRIADPDLTTPRTVAIRHPAAKMKLLPGGFEPGTGRKMMTSGMSIKARQVP